MQFGRYFRFGIVVPLFVCLGMHACSGPAVQESPAANEPARPAAAAPNTTIGGVTPAAKAAPAAMAAGSNGANTSELSRQQNPRTKQDAAAPTEDPDAGKGAPAPGTGKRPVKKLKKVPARRGEAQTRPDPEKSTGAEPAPTGAGVSTAAGLRGILENSANATPPGGETAARRGGTSQRDLPGIWHNRDMRPPSNTPQNDLSPEEIEQLEAMGYLQGTMPAHEVTGVIKHDKEKALQGLNFYTSGQAPEAHLMDMDGKVLHKWAKSFFDVWPDHPVPDTVRNPTHWRRARILPNGDIVAVWDGWGMLPLDKDSNLVWSYLDNVHHDLEALEDGTVYVLEREARRAGKLMPPRTIIDDYILVLNDKGEKIKRVSVLDSLQNSEFAPILRSALLSGRGEVFHANTLNLLDGRHAAANPAFAKGNVLTCLRNAHIVCIINPETEKVVWLQTGMWFRPHEPILLENGNMLIFDNMGLAPNRSRILEWMPGTMNVAWEYGSGEKEHFYSGILGSVSRLNNGNTLIVESENGHALEVTPGKEIVWEFYVPFTAGDQNQFIASLYDVQRLPLDFPHDWANPETEKLTVDLSMFEKNKTQSAP